MSINSENAKKASKMRLRVNYAIGLNSSKQLQIGQDVQLLAQHLITYIQQKHPQYQFTDFFQPSLVKNIRGLIKNPKHFNQFLNNIHFDAEQFFTISAYLIPHVYTSYLIKFIKEQYLKDKVVKI